MPSRPGSLVVPLVAGAVAVPFALRRHVTVLLLELGVDVSARDVTQYVLGSRFAAFVLVYALLLGTAYWAGSRAADAHDRGVVAAATFAVATAAALVANVAVLTVLGSGSRGLVFAAATTVGTSAAAGVELAVVAFAGLAAGER
ncbi:hypothetical protein [Halobacterium yunchengense]|uniref:hypothetical protein n=1 Tax=Halobacterium yunchengense TaxID=3108497 RepID=UPI00300B0BB5